jgi:uncharacterized protein
MNRATPFSYICNACGRCCRDKVITLSSYDVLRIARAAGITTAEAVRRFTVRRGSILKFRADGACIALSGTRCTIHRGRPLACRLYPLGSERTQHGERFIRLEPASGSAGTYGVDGTVADFLVSQGTQPYLDAAAQYTRLIPVLTAHRSDR